MLIKSKIKIQSFIQEHLLNCFLPGVVLSILDVAEDKTGKTLPSCNLRSSRRKLASSEINTYIHSLSKGDEFFEGKTFKRERGSAVLNNVWGRASLRKWHGSKYPKENKELNVLLFLGVSRTEEQPEMKALSMFEEGLSQCVPIRVNGRREALKVER